MSRSNGRSSRLRRRPSRAIPALIVSILLLATAVAVVWICLARLIEGEWPQFLQPWRDGLDTANWNSPSMWIAGGVAVVVGVILLLCAIVPGQFTAIRVGDEAADQMGESVMTRRAVAHLARSRCAQIDGVGSATATASNRHVHLSVKSSLRDSSELRTRVIDEVHERLESAGLHPVPRVSASVVTPR